MTDDNNDQTEQGFQLPIYKSQDCSTADPTPQVTLDMFNELQLEVLQLRAEFAKLRNQVEQQNAAND